MDILYKNIKHLRQMAELAPEVLASKLGYEGRDMINKIESGEEDLPVSKLKILCHLFMTSADRLMFEDIAGEINYQKRRFERMIEIDGCPYTESYILAHINEFIDLLKNGLRTIDFDMQCNVSDALGQYCSIDDFDTLYQILLRIYDDDTDRIDEILLYLKPDSEEAQLIRERYQEEIIEEED